MEATGIVSPCSGVCVLNVESGLCRGCWRQLDEIAGWAAMTDPERLRVMRNVEQRRTAESE
ncbi:MAG TPA: DUF1289 domain-containing protein [Stellaceae bacterium]|nr:DUF1289 domain-containing protein [Stellaceae bacterium]